MRIIIAGSREFNNYEMLTKITLDILAKLQYTYVVGRKDILIISGMAAGADKLGVRFAKEYGLNVKPFIPKWDDITTPPVFIKYRNGKPYNVLAGENRNVEMAKYAKEDKDNIGVLIAFSIDKSSGTQNMIKNAKKFELDAYVVDGYTGKIIKGNI